MRQREKEPLLKEARKRWKLGIEAERLAHEEALSDLKMLAGIHYPEAILREREANGQLSLVSNRLVQFVRRVTGAIRQINPAIKVIPGDSDAAKELTDVYEGLIRQIQYRSDASAIFERAAESAAQCSMGFFRVVTDYEDAESFDQEIQIRFIPNPFSVIFDPDARHPTRCDAKWVFVTERMTKEAFEAAYPKARTASDVDRSASDYGPYWGQGGDVVVAEYMWIETRTARLVRLADGSTVKDPGSDVPKESIVAERKIEVPRVMWAKVCGSDVLDGPQELPGRHLPVIAVVGEEFYIGDRYYRSSAIRHAKDDQMMLNYHLTTATEVAALQPKAPFMVTPVQVAGLEAYWRDAGKSSLPYLPYNLQEGAPNPPPRSVPPQPSAASLAGIQIAMDGLQATTGIFNAALGSQSNETSGRAINARKVEADISTSVYADNMAKAIEQCGRVILSMIPEVYDTQRTVRLVGKDGSEQQATINQPAVDPNTGRQIVWNDMSRGRFDVRVTVGPNYNSRRQETAESMMEFVRVFPPAAQVAGDLIAKAMDWPGAEDVADRLKKLLPPGVAEPDEQDTGPSPEMQAQQQAAQQQAQVAQAMMQLELRKAQAEVAEAEAKARKAEADAQRAAIAASQPVLPAGQAI